MEKTLDPLPPSSDEEFWMGAEMSRFSPVKIDLCAEHDYLQVGAEAKCTRCSYGTYLPGYMRVTNGQIVDLRDLTRA